MSAVTDWMRRYGWLLLVLLLAYALRVYRLDAMSFWADEALTPMRSGYDLRAILSNIVWIQGSDTVDTHPPLYFIIIHFSRRLLGTSDFAYRYISVLFGVLLIPTVYQLGRRMFSWQLGLIAAAITAINPFQIWYAQEARMYTLIVFSMAAASYFLWRAVEETKVQRLWRWLAIYVFFSGIAVYTHYTSAFPILAQGLVWLWVLWRHRFWKLLIGIFSAGILAAIPLAPIVIPRLLTGEEASFFLVPPAAFVIDVVRGFGLGRTAAFRSPPIQLLVTLLALVMFIGIWRAKSKQRNFLLIYMLAATFGLMIGSYVFKPMYLGPHHQMVGSPAFLLLIAGGVYHFRPKPFIIIPIAIVLTAQLIPLNNIYNNIDYTKDNFRDLIAYTERHATHRDLVVFNNGTLLPLYEHYHRRDDLPFTAIPRYGFMASGDTQDEVRALPVERVWFMGASPQDRFDDDKMIREVLEDDFLVVDRHWFHGRNHEMQITGYQRIVDVVDSAETVTWQGAQLPQLKATNTTENLNTWWVDLWWQSNSDANPVDYANLNYQLRDAQGNSWQQGIWKFWEAEDLDEFDASLMPTGQLHTSHALQIPAALPAGTYQLWVSSTAAADQWQQISSLNIAQSPEPTFDTATQLRFDNGVELVGLDFPQASTRPGNPLPLVAYWRFTEPLSEPLAYTLKVTGNGETIREDSDIILPAWLDSADVPLNTIVAKPLGIYPNPSVEPGEYALTWSLAQGENHVAGRPRWRFWNSAENKLGQITIEPFPLVTELPALDNLRTVDSNSFGSSISLAGYTIESDSVAAGESLAIKLFWEATGNVDDDYWVFVHWSIAADQPPLTSSNSVPVGASRPTAGWRAGEILEDVRTLNLPLDMPSGDYQLLVGFYQPETGQRLPVSQSGAAQSFDQLLLTTITIP